MWAGKAPAGVGCHDISWSARQLSKFTPSQIPNSGSWSHCMQAHDDDQEALYCYTQFTIDIHHWSNQKHVPDLLHTAVSHHTFSQLSTPSHCNVQNFQHIHIPTLQLTKATYIPPYATGCFGDHSYMCNNTQWWLLITSEPLNTGHDAGCILWIDYGT